MDTLGRRRRPYYGWVLVGTLGVTETAGWGVLYYAFTVFIKPMQRSFGWSLGTVTGAFSLALLISGLASIPAGRWLDRHGPRALMTAGSCLATLTVLGWAAVSNVVTFYLVWAAIGVAMAAVLYEPAFAVVATWFRRKRGRALTLLTFIAGFASVIFLPLSGRLVELQGWRGALVTLAIVLGTVTIPAHALVLRRRPADLGLEVDGLAGAAAEAEHSEREERSVSARPALHSGTFWWLTAAFFFNALGVSALFVHLVPYLGDRGYGSGFAAGITGVIGVMALPGRLLLTPLGDRVRRDIVACAIFSVQAVALLALLLVHSTAGVVAFVVLFGAGFGAVTPARAALVAEYYGPDHFGSINGILAFLLTAARAIAPVGAGLLYQAAYSYDPLLWSLTAAAVVSAFAILLAEWSSRGGRAGDERAARSWKHSR